MLVPIVTMSSSGRNKPSSPMPRMFLLRVRKGDVVEFHLNNRPDSRVPHNIDLHAVTGPGGGTTSSFVAPGQTATFVFKALNPGLYVYHCATAPVRLHRRELTVEGGVAGQPDDALLFVAR